jgi:hypothetical protein
MNNKKNNRKFIVKRKAENFGEEMSFLEFQMVYLHYNYEKIFPFVIIKKLLVFHGFPDGSMNTPKWILKLFHLMGYKFLCCFPYQVRKKLNFGNFLFENHKGLTFSDYTRKLNENNKYKYYQKHRMDKKYNWIKSSSITSNQ